MSTLKTCCFIYNHGSPYKYLTKECIDRINSTDDIFVVNCGSGFDQHGDLSGITKTVYDDNSPGDLNLYIGEMTGMRWLYENYAKIGNPDYICTCHYRRFFRKDDVSDFDRYDIISSSNKNIFPFSMRDQYRMNRNHDRELFDRLVKVLPDTMSKLADPYFSDPMQIFKQCNMFVMRREIFREYYAFISWLTERALEIVKPHETLNDRSDEDKRVISFALERFTSFFIDYVVILERLRHKTCFDIEFFRTKPW